VRLFAVLLAAVFALTATAMAPVTVLAVEEEKGSSECLFKGIGSDPSQPLCIRRDSYGPDLCHVMESMALANALPPEFLARLIWRESLFQADAISPKGAEGIAQFMPETARRRGLANTFNVVEALAASSRYLSDLRQRFGNLGLAAAAYNAGEAGLDNFLRTGRLPIETRDYVFAITGYPAETWRDKPPETAAPPLDGSKPFQEGCIELAASRRLREPILMNSADWAPWGVQLAAHYNPSVASRLFVNAVERLPQPLNSERALVVRQKGGNFGRRTRYAARIGRETRAEATRLCSEIRAAGIPCTVFRN
jgi:soluble lytic murein transglycosylase-like protein